MREIKFRAWNSEYKQMWYDGGHLNLSITINGVLGSPDPYYGTDLSENFVLMQYTGFKDDNGVEIYEGDILERTDSEKERFVIEFDNDKCGLMLNYYETDELYNFEELPDCRIIGNVYASFEQFKNELKAGEENNEN